MTISKEGSITERRQTDLLSQEVTDLNRVSAIADDAVDREMGIDKTHLVKEPLECNETISLADCVIHGNLVPPVLRP